MAENTPESRLMTAFAAVNDWLKYAEVKNGALLTINGALIMGVHQMLNWHDKRAGLVDAYAWMATAFLAVSLLVGLASFYARTKTFGFDIEKVTGDGATNVLYYGHLADMSRADVLARLVDNYDPATPSWYLEDLADQHHHQLQDRATEVRSFQQCPDADDCGRCDARRRAHLLLGLLR